MESRDELAHDALVSAETEEPCRWRLLLSKLSESVQSEDSVSCQLQWQYGSLVVYDVLGREVAVLVNEVKVPGITR